MQKLLAGLALASVIGVLGPAAQAECVGNHNVTASSEKSEPQVAISTYDGSTVQPVVEEPAKPVEAVATCPAGEKDCTPGTE